MLTELNLKATKAFLYGWLFVVLLFTGANAQNGSVPAKPQASKLSLPKVTQIDETALRKLLQPNGKPLLINFWATWCDPCREEFPDLVKLDADYKGRIDFITISLDDLAEINRDVPKFLAGMKAEMPAYLLKTPDESSAISSVAKDWTGGLPFTILFDASGKIAYFRQGKIKPEIVAEKIDALLKSVDMAEVTDQQITELSLPRANLYSYDKGVANAKRDFSAQTYQIIRYGLSPGVVINETKLPKGRINISIKEHGCMVEAGFPDYARGYNETMRALLLRKFGSDVILDTGF